jgi:hypothetical protein
MIPIPIEDVPELPLTDIEHDAKFGIYDDGILIHYVLKDIARLVTWEDIILLGLRDDLEISKIEEKGEAGLKEIPGPVMP